MAAAHLLHGAPVEVDRHRAEGLGGERGGDRGPERPRAAGGAVHRPHGGEAGEVGRHLVGGGALLRDEEGGQRRAGVGGQTLHAGRVEQRGLRVVVVRGQRGGGGGRQPLGGEPLEARGRRGEAGRGRRGGAGRGGGRTFRMVTDVATLQKAWFTWRHNRSEREVSIQSNKIIRWS